MEIADLSFKSQRATFPVLLLSSVSFLVMIFLRSSFATLDGNVNSWSASIHSPLLTQIALVIHYGFDTLPMLMFTMAIVAYLSYRKYKIFALSLMVAMLGNVAIVQLVKILVYSPRPSNGIIFVDGFSFPSGHVVSSMLFFGLSDHFIWKHWNSLGVKIFTGLSYSMIALVVGFDRIYLNVHWLSDVIGAYLLGIILLTLSILVIKELSNRCVLGSLAETR